MEKTFQLQQTKKPIKFLDEAKIVSLHTSIAFAANYTPDKDEDHVVTISGTKDQIHLEKTFALKELGQLNERREFLIQLLTN